MDRNLVVGILGNIFSSVSIVITNKYITRVDGYSFMIFLSSLHYIATGLFLKLFLQMGFFTYKECTYREVAPVALVNMLSVAFMNLTLQTNSVGTYQLAKLGCIPVTLVIQYFFYSVHVSFRIRMTLVLILFGVGYATVYDVDLNYLGSIYALVAIFVTALTQVFIHTYQKSLGLDAFQLLHKTAPIITVSMLLLCPFFDDIEKLKAYEYTPPVLFRIGFTCLMAILVNVTNYFVIGKTSPLTSQIIGHLKTILVLFLGFALFNAELDYRNVLGILICLIGVILYSEIKRREAETANIGYDVLKTQEEPMEGSQKI